MVIVVTSRVEATIDLQFDSLPTAQGWFYQGHVAESIAFSVDGTTLTQNTLGQGDISAVDFMNNVIDPTLPFTLSVRARVLQSDGPGSLPFGFVAFSGSEIFQAVLGSNVLRVQGQDFTLDNTQFHDFRFEITFVIKNA